MSTKIEQCRQELDQFLQNNQYKFVKSGYWSSDFVAEVFEKYRDLADALWSAGEEESAREVIRSSEYIFLDFPLFDNFVIQEDIYDTLTEDFADWMTSHGMEEEVPDLYEAAIQAAKTSYFYHFDNTGIRRVKNALLDYYDQTGDIKKKKQLMERIFDTAFYGYLNDFASIGSFGPKDLSYHAPLFKELFSVLREDKDIMGGVSLINKWLFLCDRYYIDDKDWGQAYKDYDEACYALASLYDGTDTLIKALQATESPMLDAPYILIENENHKYGYMDSEGHVVVPCQYRCAWYASSKDILSVMDDNKNWIYVSPDGTPIFKDMVFRYAYPPFDGYILFGIEEQSYIMNIITGDISPVEFEFDENGNINQGLLKIAFVAPGPMFDEDDDNEDLDEDDECVSLFSFNGQRHENMLCQDGHTLLFPEETEEVKSPNQGVIMAGRYTEDGDLLYGLYTLSGDTVIPVGKYDVMMPFGKNSLTPMQRDGLCGFINRSGEEVISPKYEDVRAFSDGLAAVKNQDFLWGFIDESGREVVPCLYSAVSDFSEGLAWVCPPNKDNGDFSTSARFGYIRSDGSTVTPPDFEQATVFYKGVAQVCQNKVWFTINKNGEAC